jgi:predicted Zn-ribbon and HTH transcriptional regulator
MSELLQPKDCPECGTEFQPEDDQVTHCPPCTAADLYESDAYDRAGDR